MGDLVLMAQTMIRFDNETMVAPSVGTIGAFSGLQTVETPYPEQFALTLGLLPAGSVVGRWRMKVPLAVLLETSSTSVLASTKLGGIVEYGEGDSEASAVCDLVDSLGEYLEILQGFGPREDYTELRRTIESFNERDNQQKSVQ